MPAAADFGGSPGDAASGSFSADAASSALVR